MRDAFAVESMRAMGQIASHGKYVHLYINGRYWGLYNPMERPDAVFSSSYHGGDEDNWDAINQDSVPDGNYDAWNRLMASMTPDWADNAMYQRVQGNNPDGTRNPAYEVLLDVADMIDYMIMNFYIGNAGLAVTTGSAATAPARTDSSSTLGIRKLHCPELAPTSQA